MKLDLDSLNLTGDELRAALKVNAILREVARRDYDLLASYEAIPKLWQVHIGVVLHPDELGEGRCAETLEEAIIAAAQVAGLIPRGDST